MPIRTDGKFKSVAVTLATKDKLQALADQDHSSIYELVDTLATEEMERRGMPQGVLQRVSRVKPRDNEELEAAVLRLALKVVGMVGIKFPPLPGVTDADLNEVSRSVDTLRQTLHSKELPGLSSADTEVVR